MKINTTNVQATLSQDTKKASNKPSKQTVAATAVALTAIAGGAYLYMNPTTAQNMKDFDYSQQAQNVVDVLKNFFGHACDDIFGALRCSTFTS